MIFSALVDVLIIASVVVGVVGVGVGVEIEVAVAVVVNVTVELLAVLDGPFERDCAV